MWLLRKMKTVRLRSRAVLLFAACCVGALFLMKALTAEDANGEPLTDASVPKGKTKLERKLEKDQVERRKRRGKLAERSERRRLAVEPFKMEPDGNRQKDVPAKEVNELKAYELGGKKSPKHSEDPPTVKWRSPVYSRKGVPLNPAPLPVPDGNMMNGDRDGVGKAPPPSPIHHVESVVNSRRGDSIVNSQRLVMVNGQRAPDSQNSVGNSETGSLMATEKPVNYSYSIAGGKTVPYPTFVRQKFIPNHRVVHFDLKGAAPKVDYFRGLFELMKQLGATGLLLEWEDMFPYSGNLSMTRHDNAYTPEEIRRILGWARDFQLDVIPLVQTFGHLEWILKLERFAHLRQATCR